MPIFFFFLLFSEMGFGQSISNYSFAASASSFTSLSTPVNPALSGGDVDDGYFNALPVGFDFWYMGNRYTTVSASTNGWLTFGANITDPLYINNLASGAQRPVVAPLWDDIDIISASNFSYKTTGSAGSRIFTLQWLNVKWDYSAAAARLSFQARIYESTGKIDFIYQQVGATVPTNPSASIGIASTLAGSGNYLSLNNASATPTANSNTETITINTRPANGQLYTFAPPIPAIPTSLSFSGIGNTGMTLNWVDNATNERGYAIYISTDGGVSYNFVNQVAANTTSSIQTGLTSNITYFWKVYAVSEGGLSTAVAGSQVTTCTPPAAPTVSSPVNYCLGGTSMQLSATGSNLLWTTGGAGTVGGTTALATTSYVDGSTYNNKKTNFTTNSSNITITKIDYTIPAYQAVNNLVLAIFNSSGTIIATSSTTTTLTAGASAVKVTNVFNYSIAASGNYSVGIASGTGNIGSDNPSYPITESTGIVNITGVTVTGVRCFNNIQFAGIISATAPTPSTTTAGPVNYYVTQTTGGCTSAAAIITVNVATPNMSQVPLNNRIGYYRFEGNANDLDGANNGILQGTPISVVDRYNNTGKAYSFNGSTQYISTANAYTNPGDFTISIWFKTTSVTGGRLIGFGTFQSGQSGQYDRHIYMNNAGQLYFGVYPGAVHTVNSTATYNDGTWHNATATLSPSAGMVLYADGAQVAADPLTTTAENYTGYWRIGYDNNGGWTSQPSNFYFTGNLDDAIIYQRALSSTEVNTLYNSPDGAGNNGPVCSGSSLGLSAITIPGASYSWTGPGAFTSGQQNPSLTYTAANAGTYTLQVTVAGCSATAYTNVVSSTNAGQWTGNISTDWAVPGNWCNAAVPTAATNVVIATGASRMPSITTSVFCNNLTIGTGATLTTTATGTLNIAGTITNSGTMANNGNTVFSGSVQQTFSGVSSFNNITISNAAGLLLPAAIVVNNNLTISAGTLNANNFSISVAGNWINNVSATAFTAGTSGVTFNGSGSQSIGGTAVTGFNNITILNTSGTVALGINANIAGNLTVTSGTFDLGTFTANRTASGGVLTVSNNAVLKIGGTNTFPVNYTTNTLVVASTVEYSGTNQTVASKTYGNLKLTSSTGSVVKTLPAVQLTVVGDFICSMGTGTAVSVTASAGLNVSGNVSIGASTTFNGSSFFHSISGNWTNDGTFNGSTGTVNFTGSGSVVSGSGSQNFNNLTVAGSQVSFTGSAITMSGNLVTTGSGSFSQAPGGTLTMTGTSKAISGTGISLNNLSITGTINTTASLNLAGNLSVTGSFIATAGTVAMSGTSKTISGAGTKSFSTIFFSGTISTDANFAVSSGITVSGSLAASAGTATFTGTSTLSGTANLFNVNVNGTSLQLSASSVLGIANAMTITSGTLNVTSSAPNTVNFNGTGSQNINAITYCRLILSNGNTKNASGNITTNDDLTIGSNTSFNASSYTITIYRNWINSGIFVPATSTIAFVGPATSTVTGVTTFNVLTSNTTGATTQLILNDNVSAATVNMTNGIITTGADTITITGSRTGNGYIYGHIRRTHSFTTGVAYAFEGPNNTITFSAVSSVGSVIVSVVQGSITDFPYGSAISRVYDINIPTGTYTATLRLHYEDAELNGNAESAMALWNYDNSLGWIPVGKSANSSTLNYVEQTGITNMSNRWTCSFNPNVVLWNGSVSADWNTAANWSVYVGTGSTPPSSSDVVVLGGTAFNYQPTISSAVTVKNIVFGTAQAVNLSMASGGSLVSGDVIGLWSSNVTHSINTNSQSININGSMTLSDGTNGHAIDLNIGSGTVVITGSLVETGGANVHFTGAGTLSIEGDFIYNSGTFTAGTGTVSYNGSENQEVAHVNYNNFIINKPGGIATINSNVNIGGNLSIISGELDNASTTSISGNVTITSVSILHNLGILHVGGNWVNNGTFNGSGINVIFDGGGTQTISPTTFNNFTINKPVGTSAVLTGDIIINGDLTVTSGTLDVKTFYCDRSVQGGALTLDDSSTFIIGGNNAPVNFTGGGLSYSSTVIANGTISQLVYGNDFGNLILRNSGAKTLITPITVHGDLTIESGSNFDAGSQTITLIGNWVNNGSFTASGSTVLLNGTGKNVSGITSFNKVTVTGSYTNLSDLTYNDLLHITNTGSLSSGTGIFTILNGDLINNGVLYTLGTTTFTGNILQTLSLINAVQTVALIVNFNGTVSPVLYSSTTPQFGYLNINNKGGVNPSVGWTILYSLTVGSGASFNGGVSTHNILGSLTNNGTITSSGILNFTPTSAVTINFGNNFTSTGRVNFAGTGAMTLAGNPASFRTINITNNNSSGVTPSSDWTLTNNLSINAGAILNAGNHNYSIAGNIVNSGTINSATSAFILNGSTQQDIYSTSSFNNIGINKTGGILTISSDVTATGILNFISGNIQTGNQSIVIASAGNVSGASSGTGWVNGKLKKYLPTGAVSKIFEVGDSVNFTPVNIAFAQITTAGSLTVSSTAGDHPQISNSSINSNLSVNRFWTLTNNGVVYTNYNARFNFIPSDMDAGASTTSFGVEAYNGAWTRLNEDSSNATNIKVVNVSSMGDFAIGEICNKNTAISYSAGTYCAGAGTANVTLSGNAGGLFTSTVGLSIDAATGAVDLAASTPGSYIVNYKIDSTGGCSTFYTDASIVVSALPAATIAYNGSPYCINSGSAFVSFSGTTGGVYTSTTGLSVNAITGEIDIAASSVGTYTVTYTVAAAFGCASFSTTANLTIVNTGTWTGAVNNDWGNAGNWLCGAIPDTSTNVSIQSGLAAYPLITTVKAIHNLTIMSGGSITIASGNLQIGGSINNSGTFNTAAGTVELNGNSTQTIYPNTFSNNTIMNLIISNNVTLAGEDTLTGTLYFGANNKTFNTGDFLTLKSTSASTARIDDITNAGMYSGNTINGKVNIERYIPLRKAWRLMSAPVEGATAPTIHAAWQENSTTASAYPNPTPGYGVDITGGSVANGFDQSINNAASIKVYNNATNGFTALPSVPGTNRPISDYPGYFLYVRGDRSIDLMQGANAATTFTTVRMKGEVKMGTQQVNVYPTNCTVLGNPYASAINFQTLDRTNVKNAFYRWDPMLAGNFGLGAYVAFIWNSQTGTYDATASASSLTQYIPSGEAILVQSADGVSTGRIDIKESDKSANGGGQSFNRSSGPLQQVRVNLFAINADSSAALLDGILTTYSDFNSNAVDQDDAKKMFGSNESINLNRNANTIAIERRKTITTPDTSFINLYQMKRQPYRLEIKTDNMDHSGLIAVLKDSYSATNNDMLLDLNGTSYVDLVINSDPASYNINRFSIVFKLLAPVPVTFRNIKAYQHEKDIAVEWTTENEVNINRYEVEKSADGRTFAKINTTKAIGSNGGAALYQIPDHNPFEGNNFYRIRSVSSDGNGSYSNIVKVNMGNKKYDPAILVYPNPVKGNTILLQLNNVPEGSYILQLYNETGQMVSIKTIQHMDNTNSESLEMKYEFPIGKYELKLSGAGLQIVTSVFKK
ncbi:MAG: fibronectin type III domain-containing protein [Ferruginibacter sp.]